MKLLALDQNSSQVNTCFPQYYVNIIDLQTEVVLALLQYSAEDKNIFINMRQRL